MSDFRLRVFAAVARHLSFTKAGQELFVSQPAVTKHIRELEAQYGQRLLERRGNRVTLTEAGRLLHTHAEAAAAAQQQLEDQLLGLRDPDEAAGRLRLGASTTLAQYVLPGLLPAFQARYPQVQLSFLNANSERIAEALLRSELDLGFVEGRTKSHDLHYEPAAARRAWWPCAAPRPAARPPRRCPWPRRWPTRWCCASGLGHAGNPRICPAGAAHQAQRPTRGHLPGQYGSHQALPRSRAHRPGLRVAPGPGPRVAAGLLEIVPIAGLHLARQFEAVSVQGQPLARPAQRFLSFVQGQLKGANKKW
ncbi:LysR family transcriptional regulator [Hymenobacter humi]|uniref:LysR family transcriptional regulator n=1 Tax=Hymenobacter humi TaxID=1411620 RepID=A0ABW2UF80_9BACT